MEIAHDGNDLIVFAHYSITIKIKLRKPICYAPHPLPQLHYL